MRNYAILAIVVAGALFLGYTYFTKQNSPSNTPQEIASTTPARAGASAPLPHIVMTTLFWVGEPSDSENAYIANDQSFWDDEWEKRFGGVDDPANRCGYRPCAFVPNENPFYFALPYGDIDKPQYKNTWIKIVRGTATCYAQWEDVGPFVYNDTEYVFGIGAPKNKFNKGAGLDVSPAVWGCLKMTDNAKTRWEFVDMSAVPQGPWLETVTTSGTNWK